MLQNVGVVVIGRNEGERLKRCLTSLKECAHIIYVDSGSSDGSVDFAKSMNVGVESLDLTKPFTAARARNLGFKALMQRSTALEFVMFIDGDCELRPTWWQEALSQFEKDSKVAAVCGRRRERFPDKTLYNFLCDVEWDTPVGEASACGGDALYRVSVFSEVQGFNDAFIAGEEPELCFRIRQAGYRILRVDAEMTWHDADMTKFAQWWKRSKRSGYAYFLNTYTHGNETPEKFKRKQVVSIVVWATLFYLSSLISFLLFNPWPVLCFSFLFAVQVLRMSRGYSRLEQAYGKGAPYSYAAMVMAGKLPQFHGILTGLSKVLMKRTHTLVEYK